ncbi:MAG: LON peptidase substrate-binding domain-containing protein, partial [Lentisphaeria bacterium]|nr:LON peptidase substrate-binding domain-containing protein [Lentisphaeria bacterium]
MAINNSNNITIAVGPSVVGERSYLLQTAGLVLYPFSLVPCNVEGRSNLDSLKAAMKGNRTLVIFPEIPNGSFGSEGALAEPESFVWDNKKRSRTGVLVRVLQRVEMPDGSVRIVVRGIKRVRYNNGYREMNGAVAVDYSPVTENDGGMSEQESTSRLRALIASFLELSSMLPGLNEEIVMAVNNAPTPGRAVDMIADALNFSFEEKIWFLSTPILLDRMEMLAILLNRELETTRLSARIQSEVHEAMGESQREFFLRE